MKPMYVLYALLIGGIIWTAIWLWVMLHVRQTEPAEEVTKKAYAIRRRLAIPMIAVLIVAFFVSVYFFPFSSFRARSIGEPQATITVDALQWAWILSDNKVPVGVPVEFVVTSRDVNHGFAIYNPDGRLLTQVQAMPGYTNRLIYQFDKPGTYLVRCLEYCGIGHPGMLVELTVA